MRNTSRLLLAENRRLLIIDNIQLSIASVFRTPKLHIVVTQHAAVADLKKTFAERLWRLSEIAKGSNSNSAASLNSSL